MHICQNKPMRCMARYGGFTLIELLVVVLIIGILSAVALPQYTKVVEKSRASVYLPMMKSVYAAQQAYYLSNGSYAGGFGELDVEASLPKKPATTYCSMYSASSDASRADDDFVITLNNLSDSTRSAFVAGARIRGDYQCGGFKIPLRNFGGNQIKEGQVYCYEHVGGFKKTAGTFCEKIYGAKYVTTWESCRFYQLP